jgi:hypothetical protein
MQAYKKAFTIIDVKRFQKVTTLLVRILKIRIYTERRSKFDKNSKNSQITFRQAQYGAPLLKMNLKIIELAEVWVLQRSQIVTFLAFLNILS